MVEVSSVLREWINLFEAHEWKVTRSSIFDESLKANMRVFPDLPNKLEKFLDVKSDNPLRNRYGKHDGPFTGPLTGFLHCHLRDDAILIYSLKNRCINLIVICTHAEIEGKRAQKMRSKLSPYLESASVAEAYAGGFKGIRGQEAAIFRNPTSKEWRECEQYGDVRAFIDGDDLIIWNPFTAVHQMVREHFNLPDTVVPVLIAGSLGQEIYVTVTDTSEKTIWWHDPDVVSEINDCAFIKRNFKNVEIGFYDEDIYGSWIDLEE